MNKGKVRLHLSTGGVFVAIYDDDEYESIYDDWSHGGDSVLGFVNCCVRAKDVILIEYVQEED